MRIVLLMLLIASLSGCAAVDEYVEPAPQPEPQPEPAPVQDVDNGTDAPENVTAEPVEDLVPQLNVTLSAINGTAPLLVNITIDASDDSETLSWIVFVDGNETHNGTEVPTTVNHTFEAGNWSLVVRLTDGNHTVSDIQTIHAMAPEAGEVQELAGSYILGAHGCVNNAYPNDATGTTFYLGAVETHTFGKPFEAVFSGTGPVKDYTVYFWKDGDPAGRFTVEESTVTGTVPDGATDVFLNSCGGGDVSVAYRAGDI